MKKQIVSTLKTSMITIMTATALSLLILHASMARAGGDCSGYGDCITRAKNAYSETDYAAATDYYEQACAVASSGDLSDCKDSASDAWLRKGDVSYNYEDYQSAIEDFTRAVELTPDEAKPYIYRGDAYQNNGNRPEAIADYSTALNIDPSNAGVYLWRGKVYSSGGKFDAAIQDYNSSIELEVTAKAYYFRGDAYLGIAEYDLGISDYTKAVELDPSMEYILLYRGDCWMFKGDVDRALADYTRVSEINPDDWKAFAYIGEIYVMKRDKANAITAIKKALDGFDSDLTDDEKGTLQLFHDSLTKTGEFPNTDDLKKEAQAAMDAKDNPRLAIYAYANFLMQPQSPEADLLLAQSYEKIGWKTNSIRFYNRYIYLAPGSKINNVVRNAIKDLEE